MSKAAIVYLVQVRHSTYGRDSLALLSDSLALLHRHYLDAFPHDCLLFHAPDDAAFTSEVRKQILAPFAHRNHTISFREVPQQYWRIPEDIAPATANTNRSEWLGWPRFSLGYRHMIRWYTIGLWEYLERRGYDWVMRMDEDSRLLSPIPYNIFERMQGRDWTFGYRMVSYESGFDGERFHSFVRNYLLNHGPSRPKWLLESCGRVGPNATARIFSVRRCGHLYGVYNNWFVSSVAFWRSPLVMRWLNHVDQAGVMYTRRYGDLLLQSVALQIFLSRDKVVMFDDFTYELSTTVLRSDYDARHHADGEVDNAGVRSPPPRPEETSGNASAEQCIEFGGVAAGVGDLSGYATVLDVLNKRPFCRSDKSCLRVTLRDQRLVLAATAGQVKLEQPDCSRSPPPYYCFAGGALVAQVQSYLTSNGSRAAAAAVRRADWKERAVLGMNKPGSLYARAIHQYDQLSKATAMTSRELALAAANITATWTRASRFASGRAGLGTCALPPPVARSPCGEVIKHIRAHPGAINLLSGVRFACPSSIHRYLSICRPEAGCVLPSQPSERWYHGAEEINCAQRALHSKAVARRQFAETGISRRGHALRHQCERLEALPSASDEGSGPTRPHHTPKRASRGTTRTPPRHSVLRVAKMTTTKTFGPAATQKSARPKRARASAIKKVGREFMRQDTSSTPIPVDVAAAKRAEVVLV